MHLTLKKQDQMEALLVYNPNAGGSAEDESEVYRRYLQGAGFDPVYRATQREEDLDEILPQAKGLIVVVGGDGTLRAVVTRLTKQNNPVALIPNGTANNVGRALGITGTAPEVILGLSEPRVRKLDVGRVSTPWAERYFLEGCGLGLYAEALSRYRPEDGKSFLRGSATLAELLVNMPTSETLLRLDGKEEQGRFILCEAMNTNALGPRLELAPHADLDDGMLDIVRIREEERESYLTYLSALAQGNATDCLSVEHDRVQKLEVFWNGFPIHYDAEYQPPVPEEVAQEGHWLTIEAQHEAIEFWLPAGEQAHE